MAHDGIFTLDLFGATALSGGLDFNATAAVGGAAFVADDSEVITLLSATSGSTVPQLSSPNVSRGENFRLVGDRRLAASYKDRARDNIAAIQLAAEIERENRSATEAEQRKLIRFIGFGASELANAISAGRANGSSGRVGKRSAPTCKTL